MRRRRLLTGATGALLVLLAAGWYFGSPWWTLWRMREAARAGDWKTVASYVDVDGVVRSTKANIGAAIAGGIARARKAENASDRDMVGAMVEDWRAELRRDQTQLLKEALDGMPDRPGEVLAGSVGLSPRVRRHGLSEFELLNPSTPSPATFIFRRHGLGWKLDEVKWGWPEGFRP